MNNPFVDDMAWHLADSIMNHRNQLKLIPRAPQHKALIQVAIIQAINEALEAAANPASADSNPCPGRYTQGKHNVVLFGPLGWAHVHCSCGWTGPVCDSSHEAIEAWNRGTSPAPQSEAVSKEPV